MLDPRSLHRAGMLAAALCAAALLAAPGCRVIRRWFPAEKIELSGTRQARADAPAPMDSASTRGLEVRLWIVDDTDWTTARLLAPYAGGPHEPGAAPAIPQRTRDLWSAWGLRLVAIPVERVEPFLSALRPLQPTNVQWLGEFADWRPVVRAGALGTDRVRAGERSVRVEQGRPRLIARSWIEPVLGADDVRPVVRLDLGMQIQTRGGTRPRGLFDLDRERLIDDEGPVFDELLCSLLLDGSSAVVIVGEAPENDWGDLPDPAPPIPFEDAHRPGEPGSEPLGPAEPGPRSVAGTTPEDQAADRTDRAPAHPARSSGGPSNAEPAKPRGATLGELMLTTPGSRIVRANEARIPPKRVVVVLIPRVSGGFSLIPPAPAGKDPGS